MPRDRSWRDLLPGLLALAAIAAVVVGVLTFARVGALRGDTLQLVVLAGSARDVLAGTEVWIAGQKVGAVRTVEFRPVGTDTSRRLALTVDVLTTARPHLRRGTRAQIRTGGSLLGAPIVALTSGQPNAPLLQDGDTVPALPQLDPQSVTGSFADAGVHLKPLRENVVQIVGRLREADSSLGAGTRRGGFAGAQELGGRVSDLAQRFRGGSVGRLLAADDPVRRRAARAAARADSIRQLLASPEGTLGRFRRDSTLADEIAAVRDEVARVRALLDAPVGTAGRALHDGALARELAELQAELSALAADVRARPLRYVVF